MSRLFVAVGPALLLASGLAGCGGGNSYELHWTLTCAPGTTTACEVKSARDCSSSGIDSVQVVARQGSGAVSALHPCFASGEGAVARGPDLDRGATTLEVSTLSPGGQVLSGPITAEADIPSSGFVRVEMNLPRPPACADGVDNDGDGLVDLADPDCKGDPMGLRE